MASTTAPTIPFGPQLIGQVEKSLNAFLHRQLDGTGLTEPQWVTLSLTVMSGATLDRSRLVDRVARSLKSGDADAETNVATLERLRLVRVGADGVADVTDAGRELFGKVRAASAEFTRCLWGDLPAEDLEVAQHVLGTILNRAEVTLAAARAS